MYAWLCRRFGGDSRACALPRRLRRLAAPVAGRLIGDPRVVRAIGQAGQRLAAAEEKFRARGIADRPVTGGFVQFQAATAAGSSAPHCHRQSDRARVRPRKHAPAPYCRARPAAIPASCVARDAPCAGAAPLKRGSWRGRTGRAGALCRLPHSASRCRVRRQSGLPKGLLPRVSSVARRDRQTRSIPSSHSFLRVAPACYGQRCDANRLKNPFRQNPLAFAGREMRAWTFTQTLAS